MGNKEALLIDMDGVIADTVGGVIKHMAYHHAFDFVHDDVKDYGFTGLPRTEIFAALKSPGFYRYLDVIKDSVKAVNQLREHYDGNVLICSAPIAGAETCEAEKREWLAEIYDEDFAREAIITPDKKLVHGRVIVEDHPEIGGGVWLPVMFDQPYNRSVTHLPRMYGWTDLGVIHDRMEEARLEAN